MTFSLTILTFFSQLCNINQQLWLLRVVICKLPVIESEFARYKLPILRKYTIAMYKFASARKVRIASQLHTNSQQWKKGKSLSLCDNCERKKGRIARISQLQYTNYNCEKSQYFKSIPCNTYFLTHNCKFISHDYEKNSQNCEIKIPFCTLLIWTFVVSE